MHSSTESVGGTSLIPATKSADQFRDFEGTARGSVRSLYYLNHQHQTLDFVLAKKAEYFGLDHAELGMWEAIERLSEVVDESDCDLELPQIDHALQTAEALRRDGHPRWMILTGLIHDVGKILHLFGEPQWAVVGDTFPVGCAFAPEIVHHDLFRNNSDTHCQGRSTALGVYTEGCGLDAVHMSWGHDEYLYHVLRRHVPAEAAYVIRYHSFYAAHSAAAYSYLMNEYDRLMMGWVRCFSAYDLYSKDVARPNISRLRPYYEDLIAEFLPNTLRW